mmetsp:Transcript_27353/g.94048  ORF Transcript_27353/g.94048 Transcript_27353/m.94048 type:complete len:210 (-) Transcript_27353:664-1293(-)
MTSTAHSSTAPCLMKPTGHRARPAPPPPSTARCESPLDPCNKAPRVGNKAPRPRNVDESKVVSVTYINHRPWRRAHGTHISDGPCDRAVPFCHFISEVCALLGAHDGRALLSFHVCALFSARSWRRRSSRRVAKPSLQQASNASRHCCASASKSGSGAAAPLRGAPRCSSSDSRTCLQSSLCFHPRGSVGPDAVGALPQTRAWSITPEA